MFVGTFAVFNSFGSLFAASPPGNSGRLAYDSQPRKQTGPINAPPVRLLDLCFVTLTEDGSAGEANPSTKRLFRRIFKRFYRADSGTGIDL